MITETLSCMIISQAKLKASLQLTHLSPSFRKIVATNYRNNTIKRGHQFLLGTYPLLPSDSATKLMNMRPKNQNSPSAKTMVITTTSKITTKRTQMTLPQYLLLKNKTSDKAWQQS